MHSMAWLDDGETVNYAEHLLELMTEAVTEDCKKNCVDTLYARDVAKVFRDLPDLASIALLEKFIAAKREVRALALNNAQVGLAISDRADDLVARLKSKSEEQELEVTRLAEVE